MDNCLGCVGRGTGDVCCVCGGHIPVALRRAPGDPSEFDENCAECHTLTRHTHQ